MKVWHVKRLGNQSYLVRAETVLDAIAKVLEEYDLSMKDIYRVEVESWGDEECYRPEVSG